MDGAEGRSVDEKGAVLDSSGRSTQLQHLLRIRTHNTHNHNTHGSTNECLELDSALSSPVGCTVKGRAGEIELSVRTISNFYISGA